LKSVPYKAIPGPKLQLPKREKGRDKAATLPFKYVREAFCWESSRGLHRRARLHGNRNREHYCPLREF
jgi:hypothetical protein